MLTAVLDWRPVAYLYGMAALAGSDYAAAVRSQKGWVRGAVAYAFHLGLAAICLAHMGIIIIPMGSLANRSILPLIPTPTGQRLTEVWKEHVDPFRVSNSYGLFRRMTGVGASEGGRPRACLLDGRSARRRVRGLHQRFSVGRDSF